MAKKSQVPIIPRKSSPDLGGEKPFIGSKLKKINLLPMIGFSPPKSGKDCRGIKLGNDCQGNNWVRIAGEATPSVENMTANYSPTILTG